MMKKQKNSAQSTDRRRGRPAGKNRTPLSLEERRARNAQYERERRNETADAMSQLAEAACCDPQIANAELLATVISQLQRRAKSKLPQDIEDLKRANENLESQIAALQSRLGQNVDVVDISEDSNDCNPDQLSDASGSNYQLEETNRRASKSQKSRSNSDIPHTKNAVRRSNKISKISKSSTVTEKINFETDSNTQSDSDSSNSDWSESVETEPTSYKLRKRSQKVSELSERTTSTYLFGTESETSQCEAATRPHNEDNSDESNQAEASELFRTTEHTTNVTNDALSAIIPENEKKTAYDDQTETALLDILTEGEKHIINEWLDCSETLDSTDLENNRVRKFLDFDDFLLDINV